ncbi:DNA recombination protein RmuC [Nocardioides marinquilinus]|uniref:DNA recombination protein RmuC n=1 Tax=Nocardioides marinquilinus TaxID=1210400 RepID=A0ABP9PE73_9ACTN
MDTWTLVALTVGLVVGKLLGHAVGVLRARPSAAVADQAVLREGLERLHDQMRELEHNRASWQGQLHQQVLDMRHTTDGLRRETRSLATALRRPQVRGRWGELHLRRTVELAGMVEHCDFTEQVRLDDGALRPDLVVHLAGGRSVVVDAKVPLDACLDAAEADDDDERAAHLARHARQVRTHIEQLGSKAYWRSLPESPEFVVLFVPAESVLAAALETDPTLIERAAPRVVLATPTTLIALLRTVAHGWTHEALTRQASEIHALGRELHERLRRHGDHLDQVGRSLNAAVAGYNRAVGSLESRVLVQARRFRELSVTDDELATPRSVELRAVERSSGAADVPESGGTPRRGDHDEPPRPRSVGL